MMANFFHSDRCSGPGRLNPTNCSASTGEAHFEKVSEPVYLFLLRRVLIDRADSRRPETTRQRAMPPSGSRCGCRSISPGRTAAFALLPAPTCTFPIQRPRTGHMEYPDHQAQEAISGIAPLIASAYSRHHRIRRLLPSSNSPQDIVSMGLASSPRESVHGHEVDA